MKKTRTIAGALLALVLVVLGGVFAAAANGDVKWFSTRMIVTGGHPLRWKSDGRFLPGPITVWFVEDDFNPATCVMVMRDQTTGQVIGTTAVDPGSCEMTDGQ